MGDGRVSRPGRLARLVLLAVLALVLAGTWNASTPGTLHAQSMVAQTEPAEGESLDEPPDTVRIEFEEPVDAGDVSLAVFDVHGERVATGQPDAAADGRVAELPLPGDLPDGTYTVHWSTGDAAGSFYSFALNRDTNPLVSSPPESDVGHDPGLLEPLGRGLGLLGALLAGGVLLSWFLVLRPVIREHDAEPGRSARRLRRLTFAGIAISLAGGLVALLGESIVVGGTVSQESIRDALLDSEFGQYWALQIPTLLALSLVVSTPSLWTERAGARLPAFALLLGGGVLLSFAMSGNAGDELFGMPAAVTIGWLHLISAAVWSGGIAATGVALFSLVREGQRAPVRPILARFGVVAGVSLIILALSGIYGTVLHAGNLAALRQTDYGVTLLVKIGLVLGLLALTVALLIWWWRGQPRGSIAVSGALTALVLLLAVVVIVQAGRLGTAEMTAREEISFQAERTASTFRADDLDGALHLTPGVVGFNRITLDLAALDGHLDSSSTQAVVRMSPRNGVDGSREVLLQPRQICSADGAIIESQVDRFEADTTHLSMAGDWDLEVLVNRLETDDTQVTIPMRLRTRADSVEVPGPPLRFEGVQANLALLTASVIVGLVAMIAIRRRAGQSIDLYALGTVVLLFFTVLALWHGRITHTADSEQRNPIPRTVESVETGRAVFETHCVECHGESATGDGPAASRLDRRPADLTADHVGTHPAGDMATWIRDGIDPAMPGFGEVLTDEEVWHLVNYVRSLSNPVTATEE